MRVLVVDDNLLSCTRLLSQASAAGWQARATGFGPQVLTMARQGRPDAVIVNLSARGGEAALVIRAFKAEPDLAPIPLLGFCGHRDVQRREAALAAGCDHVVANSAVAGQLPELVRTLIGGRAGLRPGA